MSQGKGKTKNDTEAEDLDPGSRWDRSAWARCTKMFQDAKYKLTQTGMDLLGKAFPYRVNAVIVTGFGGVGKSSVIKSATSENVLIGHSLKPCTSDCGYYLTTIKGRPYILVDTPGFNTSQPDIDVFRSMMTGLQILQPFVTYIGVLYVTDISSTRASPEHFRMLRWLENFCGPPALRNLTIVTTKWDKHNVKNLNKTAREILPDWQRHWSSLLHPEGGLPGAEQYHHGLRGLYADTPLTVDCMLDIDEQESERRADATAMIHARYHDAPAIEMQVMAELHKINDVMKTTTGRIINNSRSFPDTGEQAREADGTDRRSSDSSSESSAQSENESNGRGNSSSSKTNPRDASWNAKDVLSWTAKLAEVAAQVYRMYRSHDGGFNYTFDEGFGESSGNSWTGNDCEFDEGDFGYRMDDSPLPDMDFTQEPSSEGWCVIM